jgi:hypothetical protein
VSAADADGDGKLDLFASNACTTPASCANGSVGVLINNFVTATITKVVPSVTSAGAGQPVSFTATVTWSDGTVPDGGIVDFFDGANQIGSQAIANGAAVFTTSALPPGAHTIKASYEGTVFYNPSSGTTHVLVNPYPTSTSLASNPNPSNHGQLVVLTAVVTSSGGNTPTGRVTFKNGAAQLGFGTLDATGTATFQTSKLPSGADQLTATYQGDSLDGKSVSPVLVQTVN